MLSAQYTAYVNDIIELTRSLCIKSEQTIENQNSRLKAIGYSVTTDPRSWKYYLNLSGEYHESDAPITITSSDTLEPIVLTVDVLADHPITRIEYGPRGAYYKQLLNTYPEQRDIIPRLFNPVDIDKAIEANDFTVLWHDDHYIHDRELSLIKNLQKWVYAYSKRWNVTSMAITDPLYPAAMLAVMYHAIPLQLINLRLSTCLTDEASDFHIWAHLGSRYRLDRFRPHLNNEQTLYLYRNIDYLRFHVGKEQTMLDLQYHITQPVNVWADRYDISQIDTGLIEEQRTRSVTLKSDYDKVKSNTDINSRFDVDYCYEITRDVADYNDADIVDDVNIAKSDIESVVVDTLPTGLVELRVNQSQAARWANPEIIALHHWLYLSSLDRYTNVIEVSLGKLGNTSISVYNACILLTYAFNQINGGSDSDAIIDIMVSNVIHFPAPTTGDINRLLPQSLIDAGYGSKLSANLINPNRIYSNGELIDLSLDISAQYYEHLLLKSEPYGSTGRSAIFSAMSLIYRTYLCTFTKQYSNYADWLVGIDFPKGNIDIADSLDIISSVLKGATGTDAIKGISSKHIAAMDIMRLLTSYGIIFVTGEATRTLMHYETNNLEPILINNSITEEYRFSDGLYNANVQVSAYEKHDIELGYVDYQLREESEESFPIDVGVDLTVGTEYSGIFGTSIIGIQSGPVTVTII